MERDYKELKGCEICQKPFSLTRIRHKCKRCKLIICADCGKAKSIIVGYKVAPKTPHRICNFCRDDVTSQQDIKNRYSTSWAHLSSLGKEWLNACNIQELDLKHDYRRYLQDAEDSNAELAAIFSDLTDDLSQGRADRESYNFSLTEFFFYSQQGKERDAVRKNVENVLKAFYARYTEQGYCSLLINIVTFLLCFADEETAFYLLCFLNERIVPDRFWDSNSVPISFVGLLREKYVLKHAARKILGTYDINLKNFEIVYKKISNVMVGALLADTVNFNTQMYVWTEMFNQKSIKPFEDATVKILKHAKNYYDNFFHFSLYNFRVFICRSVQASMLKNNDVVYLSEEERRSSQTTFDDSIVDKYVEANRVLNHTLLRLKDLNTREVDTILGRIRLLIQSARAEKRDDSSYVDLDEGSFLSIFRDVETLADLEETELVETFNHLDLYKRGLVSSRVVAGMIILLSSSENLDHKLDNVFSLFAAEHQKHISPKEIPKVTDFLADILPVLNEANPTYVNFQVHLYEMLEKLRKKAKKLEKITAQDFRVMIGRYPVFKVLTGETTRFRRGVSLLEDYTYTQEVTTTQDASPGYQVEEVVENSLFPEQHVIEVDEKNDNDSDKGLQDEENKLTDYVEETANQTQEQEEVKPSEPEPSPFINEAAIKATINPVVRNIPRGKLEKDNSCQLCNMF